MHKNLLKISLLTLLTVAVAAMAPSSRADDTNAAAAAAPSMTKGKISGTVSAVDTNAMTFVVDDQTYSVTDDSQLTRNGKPATLADVVVGDPVKGGYVKGDDGKMTAAKVHFGKSMKKKKKTESSDSTETNAPAASQ